MARPLFGALFTVLAVSTLTASALAQSAARIAFSAPVSTLISTKPTRYTTYTQIFSMNPDGSGVTQLTSGAVDSDNPAWSPNQQYIAFTRGTEVTVMQANGSGAFPVATAVGAGVSSLSWSADGTELAFTSGDANNDLYVVSVNTANETAGTPALLAPGPSYDVNWSPDGTKLAFDRYDSSGNSAIIVHEMSTGAEYNFSSQISDPGSWGPSWSPDSTMLAFQGVVTETVKTKKGTTTTTTYPLCIANAEATDFVQVAPYGVLPTWSPDGTTLAFSNGGIYKTVISSGVVTFLRGGSTPDWNP